MDLDEYSLVVNFLTYWLLTMFWFDKKIVDYIMWWWLLGFTKDTDKRDGMMYSVSDFMRTWITEMKKDFFANEKTKNKQDKSIDKDKNL